MTTCISNFDDVIDSRDIIERIAELRDDAAANDADEAAELAALQSLAADAKDYAADWHYGETLIRDSYFVTYAQELAEDCCEMPDPDKWPLYCIDWDQAARDLRMDYSSVEFGGTTYWIR